MIQHPADGQSPTLSGIVGKTFHMFTNATNMGVITMAGDDVNMLK